MGKDNTNDGWLKPLARVGEINNTVIILETLVLIKYMVINDRSLKSIDHLIARVAL